MKNKIEEVSYELHPLCTLFPRMAGKEFDALVADIKTHGQREPIITHDGMILDGGNRYRACVEAGVQPQFMRFGGQNIVSYVLSANLHRRHMTSGQMAAIVSSAQDWAEAQTVGKPKSGTNAGLDTIASRSAVSGASDRTQRKADKVAKASPELSKDVAHGSISLNAAVAKVEGKKAKQKEIVKAALVPSDDLSKLREENASLKEWGNENAKTAEELLSENEAMAKVVEADDKMAALLAENKKLREQVRVLTERNNGLLNSEAQAKKAAQSWQRKFLTLEKSIKREVAKAA